MAYLLDDIGSALATQLKTLTEGNDGLKNVYSWHELPATLNEFPVGLLLPGVIQYDQDFTHHDTYPEVRFIICVERTDMANGVARLMQFMGRDNENSVTACLDANHRLTIDGTDYCDEAHCEQCLGIGNTEWGTGNYLSAEFRIRILA